jgi:hypothetical protein
MPRTSRRRCSPLPALLSGGVAGLRLADARLDSLRTGYGVLSQRPIAKSRGVEFVYGSRTRPAGSGPYLQLSEALSPQLAYFGQTAQHAAPRTLSLAMFGRTFWVGQLRIGRLFVTIEGTARGPVVAAARALAGTR